MAGLLQAPHRCPLLLRPQACRLRPRLGASNGSLANMKARETYHIEVDFGDDEPPENGMRRFRMAVKYTNILVEAKRRQEFEDSQAEKKRRTREMHARRSRRYIPPPTYDDTMTVMEPAPFSDLFDAGDDIFADGFLDDEFQDQNGQNGQNGRL